MILLTIFEGISTVWKYTGTPLMTAGTKTVFRLGDDDLLPCAYRACP